MGGKVAVEIAPKKGKKKGKPSSDRTFAKISNFKQPFQNDGGEFLWRGAGKRPGRSLEPPQEKRRIGVGWKGGNWAGEIKVRIFLIPTERSVSPVP